jgi:hypothetical protein
MAEMRLLMKYFSQFDGNTTWEETLPFAERLYHPEMVVVTAKGSLAREEFKQHVKTFTEKGGAIEMLKLEKVPQGIRYELIFHNPDGTTNQTQTMGTFREGRLFRVEPDEPDVYTKVLDEK